MGRGPRHPGPHEIRPHDVRPARRRRGMRELVAHIVRNKFTHSPEPVHALPDTELVDLLYEGGVARVWSKQIGCPIDHLEVPGIAHLEIAERIDI